MPKYRVFASNIYAEQVVEASSEDEAMEKFGADQAKLTIDWADADFEVEEVK